ncbi:uncharacterized protein LOC131299571 [Rhododendron vialii]|uniref:uncharacterized protein LOC131299571 n=1 Tax=Rhododendron vialii TaxID=182163 RepID=UPI00265EF0FE|nr:uncharacterized protein LOC131299571 [Rhododendron vialii]
MNLKELDWLNFGPPIAAVEDIRECDGLPLENNGNGGEGGDGGRGDEVRSKSGAEALGVRINDQSTAKASSSIGAEVTGGGSGDGGHAVEVSGDGERHTPREVGHTPVGSDTEGPRVQRLDFRRGVEGLVVIGGGLSEAGGSGGDGGGRSGTPPRDPTRGKDPVVVEESSGEVPVEVGEFRPVVGSSVHVPITYRDFAKFVTEEKLGRLLRENPVVVAAVISAREERQREIARAQEEERV